MSNPRLSSAHVLAAIAIFIALGGSALAVSAQSIKSKHVRDNSLKSADIRDAALTGADIAGDSLTGDQINESSLKLDLPAPPNPNPPAGGPPSGPAAGALTGTYPNPGLGSGVVGAAQIAANGVGADEIGSNAVESPEIGTNAVTSSELASNSVDAGEIADNAIDAGEIQNGSLTGDDVGTASGTAFFDFPVVFANECLSQFVSLGVSRDLSTDAIVVTPGANWPGTVSLTERADNTAGAVILTACNPSQSSVNPPTVAFNWVAFRP